MIPKEAGAGKSQSGAWVDLTVVRLKRKMVITAHHGLPGNGRCGVKTYPAVPAWPQWPPGGPGDGLGHPILEPEETEGL